MSGALITSANSIKALIVVRDLGRKGIATFTADSTKTALSSRSKYSHQYHRYTSPLADPQQYLSDVRSTLESTGSDVLMPVHSEDTYIIAKNRSLFEPLAKVPLHDYETIINVNNKGFLARIAEELGFPVPKTFLIHSIEDLGSVSEEVSYPAVIKLRESSSSIGLSYANSKEDLIKKFTETVNRFNLAPRDYPLIQEYIIGDGYGVSLLFNQGDPRASFTHKRIREYPISGGPSSCRESVRMPQMEKIATDLLKHFEWHGVAMVEFKLTPEKKPVLMEVNPRFWGSVNQGILSGVDFPYLLYTMAVEGDVKPVFNYKLGVITRNAFIDSVALLQTYRKTKEAAILKELLRVPGNDDIFSLDDPLPALHFLRQGVKAFQQDTRGSTKTTL